MKKKYQELNVLNRADLDSLKVGDIFIFNNDNFCPMTVYATTRTFVVGKNLKKHVYSLITKDMDGRTFCQADGDYPYIGPDSFFCLGYEDEKMAQQSLDDMQIWWDLPKELKSRGIVPGVRLDQDPRSRRTISLKTLKVMRK